MMLPPPDIAADPLEKSSAKQTVFAIVDFWPSAAAIYREIDGLSLAQSIVVIPDDTPKQAAPELLSHLPKPPDAPGRIEILLLEMRELREQLRAERLTSSFFD